ncbi:MAG: pantetheine-phosphate adenylyltransferase [Candidatus Marsarchaeota archaeon]|nr:pantetheine-phosphate adenylyltransferase [Candidatus Marsarchaeota archaeon]
MHKSKRRGVYAGSFDPPTNGHLWMIREGARLFDELVVAIGVNPEKRTMFTIEERRAMLSEITKDLANVIVASFENKYLVTYAKSIDAGYILRGVRSAQDYAFEHTMQQVNFGIDPDIRMVFQMPPKDIENISSSQVKELVGPEGWIEVVSRYVPQCALEALMGKAAKAGHR